MPQVLTSYADALPLLLKRDAHQAMYRRCPALMANVILNLEGDRHRERKRLMSPLFRRTSCQAIESWLAEVLLPQLDHDWCGKSSLDLPSCTETVMFHVSSRMLGLGDLTFDPALLEWVSVFSVSATAAQSAQHEEALNRTLDDALERFRADYFDPAFNAASPTRESHTLLPMLKAAWVDGHLDRALCVKEAAFFLQASLFSTSNAAVHVFHELASWLEANEAQRLRFIEEPLWAQRCVMEALRLHPASPVMIRELHGDQLEIDLLSINQDPEVFGTHAAIFWPDRPVRHLRSFSGLSFGAGHHSCPGREIAAGLVRTEKRPGDPAQIGVITRMLKHWVAQGMVRDPSRNAERVRDTTRSNWASYPVKFEPGRAVVIQRR